MMPGHRCLPLTAVADGTSQTILVGEKAVLPQVYAIGSWFWDEPFFLGSSGGTSRKGTSIVPDDDGSPAANNWGSRHAMSASFLFCDGSVRQLSFETPPEIVQALLTPSGGEILAELP
jgi:prepilin-type processing-associated H-X9-DG protein